MQKLPKHATGHAKKMDKSQRASIHKLTVSLIAFSGATPNNCGKRPANIERV